MNCPIQKPAIAVRRRNDAFTLVEVMIGVGILGVMMVSFYGGFAFAFNEIRVSRENVRATQILEERMEVVRLLNWDQLVNMPGYIPSTFSAAFYSENVTNPPPDNFLFSGTVAVANAPITENYAEDLRMITIEVNWMSGKIPRKRKMTTFVSQYGMQKYIY
jgi:prepilin-type N-terminal cleavage/methylation domain-containing protein